MESHETQLVCIVDAIPQNERAAHFALLSDLFRHRAQEKKAVPNGYRFRFPSEMLDKLMEFVSRERRCCPFLTFSLTVTPSSGPVWLEMTGPEGTRDFLAAELGGISTE